MLAWERAGEHSRARGKLAQGSACLPGVREVLGPQMRLRDADVCAIFDARDGHVTAAPLSFLGNKIGVKLPCQLHWILQRTKRSNESHRPCDSTTQPLRLISQPPGQQ